MQLSLLRNNTNLSSSIEYNVGVYSGMMSPSFCPNEAPIGNRDKARPEVTELIEKQRSRLNSHGRKGLSDYNSASQPDRQY